MYPKKHRLDRCGKEAAGPARHLRRELGSPRSPNGLSAESLKTHPRPQLAKGGGWQGWERLANARTRGRYGRARSRAAELRRTRYEAVLSLLGRPGSELAPASKDLSVLPLNSNLIHFHPQNASEHELCQKINEYCEAVKPEEERRQIAAASLGEVSGRSTPRSNSSVVFT